MFCSVIQTYVISRSMPGQSRAQVDLQVVEVQGSNHDRETSTYTHQHKRTRKRRRNPRQTQISKHTSKAAESVQQQEESGVRHSLQPPAARQHVHGVNSGGVKFTPPSGPTVLKPINKALEGVHAALKAEAAAQVAASRNQLLPLLTDPICCILWSLVCKWCHLSNRGVRQGTCARLWPGS